MAKMNNFLSNDVDIYAYPELSSHLLRNKFNQITIGDLHANPIKLLYSLVHHGLVSITADHYNELVELYKAADPLTSKILRRYRQILATLDLMPGAAGLVTLIGDELADRGQNDVLILELLKRMHDLNINYDISLSNHGFEFICSYETARGFKQSRLYSNACSTREGERFFIFHNVPGEEEIFDCTQLKLPGVSSLNDFRKDKAQRHLRPYLSAYSMASLHQSIEEGVVSRRYIDELIQKVYKPHLKLLSYTIEVGGKGFNLYSHAPIDLHVVMALADLFKVTYQDRTRGELATTIDAINQKFASFRDANQIHALYAEAVRRVDDSSLQATNPVDMAIWNRDYKILRRDHKHRDYEVNYIHGHDQHDPQACRFNFNSHIFSVDSDIGKKVDGANSGNYNVLCSQGYFNVHTYRADQAAAYKKKYALSRQTPLPSLTNATTLAVDAGETYWLGSYPKGAASVPIVRGDESLPVSHGASTMVRMWEMPSQSFYGSIGTDESSAPFVAESSSQKQSSQYHQLIRGVEELLEAYNSKKPLIKYAKIIVYEVKLMALNNILPYADLIKILEFLSDGIQSQSIGIGARLNSFIMETRLKSLLASLPKQTQRHQRLLSALLAFALMIVVAASIVLGIVAAPATSVLILPLAGAAAKVGLAVTIAVGTTSALASGVKLKSASAKDHKALLQSFWREAKSTSRVLPAVSGSMQGAEWPRRFECY